MCCSLRVRTQDACQWSMWAWRYGPMECRRLPRTYYVHCGELGCLLRPRTCSVLFCEVHARQCLVEFLLVCAMLGTFRFPRWATSYWGSGYGYGDKTLYR